VIKLSAVAWRRADAVNNC